MYTFRKQKEMTQKAISNDKKENQAGYDGYDYKTPSFQSKREEKLRRDKFAWKVGYFIMSIIFIVGCYAIYWAATL
tara:strand:+ start:568 stop:795 length:228 start_codon:yes stop_codon:yes gene_type:complete